MKNERLREQMILKNKINGLSYTVVQVTGTGKDKAAIAKAYNEFDGEVADIANINAANCICFRIVSDKAPYGVPEGYSVENGVLMHDGEPAIKQGEIKIRKLIGCIENHIILVCEDNEKYDTIFAYNVARDVFIEEGTFLKDAKFELFSSEDGNRAMLHVEVREMREDDTEEKRSYTAFSEGAFMFFAVEGSNLICKCHPINEPVKELEVLFYNDLYELSYRVDEYVDNETREICSFKNDEFSSALVSYAVRDRFVEKISEYRLENTRILDVVNSIGYGSKVVFGEEKMVISTAFYSSELNTPLAGKLFAEGYRFLVDVRNEDGVKMYSFAKEDCSALKVLVSDFKADRGPTYYTL